MKVHYATALDWFIICSFLYCMASILEFAGVHYFTKVGSGETFGTNDPLEEEEEEFVDDYDGDNDWEDLEDWNNSSLPVSVINSGCPPPPPTPPRRLSARNNLYGLNGSLSDSTESLPVLDKVVSCQKRRITSQHFILLTDEPTLTSHSSWFE